VEGGVCGETGITPWEGEFVGLRKKRPKKSKEKSLK